MSVLQPGTLLNQQYKIDKKVGGGGGGNVYAAIDLNLGRQVAIKHLILPSDEAINHFKKEARLLASLKHDCLPQVYNQFDEGPSQFLVMEYIDGTDLAEYLDQQTGPLAIPQVLAWADELLKLLDYLHNQPTQPVIHRDIKPANIKLSATGQLKLIDFGLAKSALSTQFDNVFLSVRGYTLTYAPLEQLAPKQGERTDQRSDIFAFGATLYHLLTGKVPVAANHKPIDAINRQAMVIQAKPDPLVRPKRLNSAIPEYVDAAIIKAMAINQADRFSSAAEFRQALKPSVVVKLSSGISGLLSSQQRSNQPITTQAGQSSSNKSSQQPHSTPSAPVSTPNPTAFDQPLPIPTTLRPTPLKRFAPLLALLLVGLIGGGWWWVKANPAGASTDDANQQADLVLNAIPNQPSTDPASGSGIGQPTITLGQVTATLIEPSATTTAEPTTTVVVQPTAQAATARPVVQPTSRPATARPAAQPTNPPPPSDRDGDGVIDANDPCPDTNGPNNGCPAPTAIPDRDGDGVIDTNDPCPDVAGPNNGCPVVEPTAIADSDGDTIPDDRDNCPNEPGDPSRNGCPKPKGPTITPPIDPNAPNLDPPTNTPRVPPTNTTAINPNDPNP